MHPRLARWALVALPVAGLSAGVLLLGGAARSQGIGTEFIARGCDHRTPIGTLPYTISSSGSFYLISELTGVSGSHGITVDADDVSIDLAGFGLTGAPGSLDGIHVTGGPRTHLRVSNGWIEGWGGDGVDAQELDYSSWRTLRIAGNGAYGLLAGDHALVRECKLDANAGSGLRVGLASVVTHTSSQDNVAYGMRAQGVLFDCSSIGNGDDGLVLDGAAVVRSCLTRSNDGTGIRTASEALILEAVTSGDGSGIQTGAGSFGEPCLVAHCRGSGSTGALVQVGFANYLFDNTMYGAPSSEAFLLAGDHSRLDSNQANDCNVGVRTGLSADGNLIVRNSAADCTAANYDIVAGNFPGPSLPLPGPGPSWSNFDL
jgi:hypothetical protein